MTDAEYRKWAKRNGVFACKPMNARITSRTCKRNQQKARKVARGVAQHDDPNGYGYGDAFRCYCACAGCKRADPPIKRRPINAHTELLADLPSALI